MGSAKEHPLRGVRGAILLHALVLVALLAWISSALLNWGMGRQIQSLRTKEGGSDEALLSAAQAKIAACIENYNQINPASPWPVSGAACSAATFNNIVNAGSCMQAPIGIPIPPSGTSFRFESSSFTAKTEGTFPNCKVTLTLKKDSML